jgi:hypothetical protein
MELGDLLINDADSRPPLPVLKVMAVVAQHMHAIFDDIYGKDHSRGSCVLVSAVLRDFLLRVGFADAEVRSVTFYIERRKGDEIVRNLLIGKPDEADVPDHWNGHMIVSFGGWLIDGTLYQARRPHWSFLPGMVATPIRAVVNPDDGIIANIAAPVNDEIVHGTWIDMPENDRWKSASVLRRVGKLNRDRRAVVNALVAYYQRATVTDDEVRV